MCPKSLAQMVHFARLQVAVLFGSDALAGQRWRLMGARTQTEARLLRWYHTTRVRSHVCHCDGTTSAPARAVRGHVARSSTRDARRSRVGGTPRPWGSTAGAVGVRLLPTPGTRRARRGDGGQGVRECSYGGDLAGRCFLSVLCLLECLCLSVRVWFVGDRVGCEDDGLYLVYCIQYFLLGVFTLSLCPWRWLSCSAEHGKAWCGRGAAP